MTNTELVVDFMEFGSPLNQVFVIDAISKLARIVVDQQDQLRVQMQDGFVEPEAWIKCAKDWIEKSDSNYK